MLAVEMKRKEVVKPIEQLKKEYEPKDTIVKKVSYETEVKDGCQIRRRKEKLVNYTKIAVETKKALKAETAMDKVISMQKEMINKGVL